MMEKSQRFFFFTTLCAFWVLNDFVQSDQHFYIHWLFSYLNTRGNDNNTTAQLGGVLVV